jgi:hypothetical protein
LADAGQEAPPKVEASKANKTDLGCRLEAAQGNKGPQGKTDNEALRTPLRHPMPGGALASCWFAWGDMVSSCGSAAVSTVRSGVRS